MTRMYLPFFVLLSACLPLHAQAIYPKREFRGAWIQTVNGQFCGLPSGTVKAALTGQLDALQAAGMNVIMFQVRPEADALYNSAYEPWSRFLTGVQGMAPEPYWDPLEFMVEECHRRNMELHAWINPYRAKTNITHELASTHIYNMYPERFVVYDNKLFFDPAFTENRIHICKVITDIVNRYDVDGIHMDDYFYPYPDGGTDYPDDGSFAVYGGDFTDRGDWRRNNVNLLIREIHETVRALKPWVKFGVSPFGVYRNQSNDPSGSDTKALQNYDDLYADVLLWVREGWIDYNIPQIYWHVGHPLADYRKLVDWWACNAENRPLFIGQSVPNTIMNADPENMNINQLPRKMSIQRSYRTIGGSCQWPAGSVVNNEGCYRDALMQEYHKYPALQPVFEFMDNEAPGRVGRLKKAWTEDGYMLFWEAPEVKDEMNRATHYVIYRFGHKEKVNLDDPSRIVSITRNTYYKLPYTEGKTKCHYVVTALDRLQNESRPVSKKIKL